jgi:hypothetical protein
MGAVYDSFLASRRLIRQHPDWSDHQIAEAAGIHPMLVAETVAVARRDVEADTVTTASEAAEDD